jgi:hypothetical protein
MYHQKGDKYLFLKNDPCLKSNFWEIIPIILIFSTQKHVS